MVLISQVHLEMNPTTVLEHSHIPFASYAAAELPENRIPVLIREPLTIGLEDTSGTLPYGVVKAMQR
jgi:hypothetical protein